MYAGWYTEMVQRSTRMGHWDCAQVCWDGTLGCYRGIVKGIHECYMDMVPRGGTWICWDSAQDGILQGK